MANQDKSKWRTSSDRLTAEFTSGQLVIAICVSLFFMLTCFLLGVLVGKYDGSLRPQEMREAQAEAQPADTGGSSPPSRGAEGGVQTYPRTDALTRQATPSSTSPYTRREERSGPRVTELAPLPSRKEPAGEPAGDAPLKIAKEPGAQESAPPVPDAVAAPLVAIDPPAETLPPAVPPTAPAAAGVPGPNVATGPPSAAAPVAAPSGAGAGKGKFGIQVAAFLGTSRKEKAEACLSQLKSNPEWGSQLVSLDDGKYHRVMITGFPDRAAANAACTALRRKAGFGDAFVRPLP